MLRCHRDPPIRSLEHPKRGQKPRRLPFFRRTRSPFLEEKEENDSLKMNERCGNVIENKGPHLEDRRRSGNVYENKGDPSIKRECS